MIIASTVQGLCEEFTWWTPLLQSLFSVIYVPVALVLYLVLFEGYKITFDGPFRLPRLTSTKRFTQKVDLSAVDDTGGNILTYKSTQDGHLFDLNSYYPLKPYVIGQLIEYVNVYFISSMNNDQLDRFYKVAIVYGLEMLVQIERKKFGDTIGYRVAL